jgi:hypothetical protein
VEWILYLDINGVVYLEDIEDIFVDNKWFKRPFAKYNCCNPLRTGELLRILLELLLAIPETITGKCPYFSKYTLNAAYLDSRQKIVRRKSGWKLTVSDTEEV